MSRRIQRSVSAGWFAADLSRDRSWIVVLDATDRHDLLVTLRRGYVLDRPLLSYRRSDFPFATRTVARLKQAIDEAEFGYGVGLLRGLPREGLTPSEFEILVWAIGLHLGVARPQSEASGGRYVNVVTNVGDVYRSPTGQGYGSAAELDYHVDLADVVCLGCYNEALEGGDSMCSSSTSIVRHMQATRPDLAAALQQPYPFALQGKQLESGTRHGMMPVVSVDRERVFCLWVRSRTMRALAIPGVQPLSDLQQEAIDMFEGLARSSEFAFQMHLAPGDMQFIGNHTVLHSRTAFRDSPDPLLKRMLFRLWLVTSDSPALPPGWAPFYGSTSARTVRGGNIGQHYDDECKRFDGEQAGEIGMLSSGLGREA